MTKLATVMAKSTRRYMSTLSLSPLVSNPYSQGRFSARRQMVGNPIVGRIESPFASRPTSRAEKVLHQGPTGQGGDASRIR